MSSVHLSRLVLVRACCALVLVTGALIACEPVGGGEQVDSQVDAATDQSEDQVGVEVDADTQTTEVAEDLVPDSTVDERLAPRFDPDGAGGFYRMPWPMDARRDANGHNLLSDFPNRFAGITPKLIAVGESLSGFSTMPVVYIGFTGPLERLPVPAPRETLSATSDVQLLRLGDGCGERVPVITTAELDGDQFFPSNTLTVRPVPGFVLKPGATYGLIVRESLGAGAGVALKVPPVFEALRDGEESPLQTSFAPLWACLPQAGVEASGVWVASVFTVNDPVAELRTIRDQVRDPQQTPTPTIREWHLEPSLGVAGRYRVYFAEYDTPIYQKGVSPYDSDGGFVFDAQGVPQVQRQETVPMAVMVPESAGPHPVLIWSDGTGASRTSHMSRAVVSQAIDAGFAVASFVPQMHDIRAPAGADATIHSFNFMNLESGRTVFRQQVIDTLVYIRVLRDQLPLQAGVGELDSSRLVYGGHSQGGIVGAMTAGVDPDLVAYVLNGTGSYLSVTVVHRTDPADIAALLSAIMGLSKDRIRVEHPLVQLMQLTADAVDPQNYSPYWAGDAERPAGASVFLTNGLLDVTTFPPSIDAMTISGDAAPIAPMGWDPDPFGVWERDAETSPIQGNRQAFDGSDLTTASFLSATTGHPTLHLIPALQAAAVEFWSTALVGVPRVVIR